MIDLKNLPSPEVFKLQDFPGINPDLIREKFAECNVEYLISLFHSIQRSKHRAESLAQIYFNQMEVLHKKLDEARRGDVPARSTERKAPTPKPSESSLALDL